MRSRLTDFCSGAVNFLPLQEQSAKRAVLALALTEVQFSNVPHVTDKTRPHLSHRKGRELSVKRHINWRTYALFSPEAVLIRLAPCYDLHLHPADAKNVTPKPTMSSEILKQPSARLGSPGPTPVTPPGARGATLPPRPARRCFLGPRRLIHRRWPPGARRTHRGAQGGRLSARAGTRREERRRGAERRCPAAGSAAPPPPAQGHAVPGRAGTAVLTAATRRRKPGAATRCWAAGRRRRRRSGYVLPRRLSSLPAGRAMRPSRRAAAAPSPAREEGGGLAGLLLPGVLACLAWVCGARGPPERFCPAVLGPNASRLERSCDRERTAAGVGEWGLSSGSLLGARLARGGGERGGCCFSSGAVVMQRRRSRSSALVQ